MVGNLPRKYEFYHPNNYSSMSTLIEIKSCISSVTVATADSYADLLFKNNSYDISHLN